MTTPTVIHTRPPNRSELDALAAAADLVHRRRLDEPELLRVWHAMARSATSAGMDPSLALVDVLRTTLAAVLTERIEAEDIDRALTDATPEEIAAAWAAVLAERSAAGPSRREGGSAVRRIAEFLRACDPISPLLPPPRQGAPHER